MDRPPSDWSPQVLILSASGSLTFGLLGVLVELESLDWSRLDTIVGISSASILALLLVCGYTVRETFCLVYESQMITPEEDFRLLEKKLLYLVNLRFGRVPTLSELVELTGKVFITSSLALSAEGNPMQDSWDFRSREPSVPEFHSPETDLDLPCVRAVLLATASATGPLIWYNSSVRRDSLSVNPCPVDYFDDGQTDILCMESIPNGSGVLSAQQGSQDQLRRKTEYCSSLRCRYVRVVSTADSESSDRGTQMSIFLQGRTAGERFRVSPQVRAIQSHRTEAPHYEFVRRLLVESRDRLSKENP